MPKSFERWPQKSCHEEHKTKYDETSSEMKVKWAVFVIFHQGERRKVMNNTKNNLKYLFPDASVRIFKVTCCIINTNSDF